MSAWRDDTPIYKQLKERVVGEIIEGTLLEGSPAPSARDLAGQLQVNPLTALKAYQELTDEGVLDKRRGLGPVVALGARGLLTKSERTKFLQNEWPLIVKRIDLLGLSSELLQNTHYKKPTDGEQA